MAPTAWDHYGTLRRQVSCTSELPDLLTQGEVSNQALSMPSVIDSLWNSNSLHIRHAHRSEKLSLGSSAQLWVHTYLRFTEQQTKGSCTEAGSPRVRCKSQTTHLGAGGFTSSANVYWKGRYTTEALSLRLADKECMAMPKSWFIRQPLRYGFALYWSYHHLINHCYLFTDLFIDLFMWFWGETVSG